MGLKAVAKRSKQDLSDLLADVFVNVSGDTMSGSLNLGGFFLNNVGQLTVDNLRLDGNDISSTSGDINLLAFSGVVTVGDGITQQDTGWAVYSGSTLKGHGYWNESGGYSALSGNTIDGTTDAIRWGNTTLGLYDTNPIAQQQITDDTVRNLYTTLRALGAFQ